MRTTLIIDDELLAKAQELSGLQEKTAVLHAGLQALISRENARRLAALGGNRTGSQNIARRRRAFPASRCWSTRRFGSIICADANATLVGCRNKRGLDATFVVGELRAETRATKQGLSASPHYRTRR